MNRLVLLFLILFVVYGLWPRNNDDKVFIVTDDGVTQTHYTNLNFK